MYPTKKRVNITVIQKQIKKLVDETDGNDWNDVQVQGYHLKFTRSTMDAWTTEIFKHAVNLLLVAQSNAIIGGRDCVTLEDLNRALEELRRQSS